LKRKDCYPKSIFSEPTNRFLVNLNHVQKIERHQINVSNNECVAIAANYHDDLIEALRQCWKVK